MYNVSQKYKEQMKIPIRNHSYMKVLLGLINQEAQMTASVSDEENYTQYSDLITIFSDKTLKNEYASYEQDYWTADGSMYFIPRNTDNYRKGALITNNLFGSSPIYIKFDIGYGASDILGMSIQFDENYPTEFSIITSKGTEYEYANSDSYFVTSQIFTETDSITLKINSMYIPNNRIKIHWVEFGVGLEYDNEWIMSADSSSVVSTINEDLPEVNYSVTLKNEDQRFNVDNPSSEINFLESGQKMSVMYGYELDDGTVEWQQLHTLFVNEWSADDTQATIKAVDRFKYMSDSYYKGQYYEDGITLYDLAKFVLEDAGVESTDYYLDSYLKKVTVHNPLPNVTHKEALQIIANAGRCIMDYDRYGRIRIYSAFIPEYVAESNGTETYSNVRNVQKEGEKIIYASYAQDYWTADGTMLFLPKDYKL